MRFIPLTGVTLPLVSYGGSSVLATFTMFGIVSAIFMLQEERLEKFRLRYEEERKMYDSSRNYQSYADRGSREAGSAGGGDGDFYRDFKGVPIYDPSKDYEDMKPFDM